MFDLILQAPVDSTAAAIGGAIGAYVSGYAALGLGFVTKFATDMFLKVKGLHDKLPTMVKPFVAFAIALGLTFVNSKVKLLGGPEITDATVIPALVAWAASMGFHSLTKAIFKK